MNNQLLLDEIPSLDLSDFTSGNAIQKEQFIQALGNAFNNIGFVALKNHGLSDELRENLYEASKEFF
jgi:isopenicillin N synthase-like dioxygenase